jgi:hypothetical protein
MKGGDKENTPLYGLAFSIHPQQQELLLPLCRHSCVLCLALIICVQEKSFIALSFFCSLHLRATGSLSAKLALLCALTENPNLPFPQNILPSS